MKTALFSILSAMAFCACGGFSGLSLKSLGLHKLERQGGRNIQTSRQSPDCRRGVFSPERDLTVEFPVFDQIIADDNVKAGMLSEWEATLNDCTLFPTNRLRERGFWVFLDTAGDNAYSCGNSIPGDWFLGPFVPIVSVDLGARPGPNLSDVAPNASGANYAVSSFHAHPPRLHI